MSRDETHSLHSDGGARGNPGPAALGYVLTAPDGSVVSTGSRYLGKATNNVAEYEALLWGLRESVDAGVARIRAHVDSELVARQIAGEYKVKDEKLRPLHAQALEVLSTFDDAHVVHVRREENQAADALVNAALDERLGVGSRDPLGGTWHLTIKGHFDAAHALEGYPGECRELHGHTWDVEATVVGESLDDIGIVYDFKRLKADLAEVLEPFDHAHLNEVPPFDEANPTAENLAEHICDALIDKVAPGVTVTEVAVWESPVARIAYRPR